MIRLAVISTIILASLSSPVIAQDLGQILTAEGSITTRSIQLFLLLTVLSLVPALAIMFTCFPFMVTVLSILRQGLGLQQSPPNMLLITLALFLTYFVMEPVFTEAWNTGVSPLLAEDLQIDEAVPKVIAPFRAFMLARLDIDTYLNLGEMRAGFTMTTPPTEAPMSLILPSFMLSEMARAFQVGFLLFLPFLIIDLVVAAVLMSMGMMMVPPAMVALPFKLAFFVVADGWSLIASALVRSYS